jgi:phosphate transport system protein
MPRNSYQESLTTLRDDVVEMGELVVDRLDDALEALENGDRELAQSVIDGDEQVNTVYLELEQKCIDISALQQPVASDLRFVASSFKIITDLERVGDLAVNLGEYALAADGRLAPEVDVETLGRRALSMVERGLDAYEIEDIEACRAIADEDDELDALCQRASETLARELIKREPADDSDSRWTAEQLLDDVSRLLLTIRDIERVGDHAVNIAARTVYVANGETDLIY